MSIDNVKSINIGINLDDDLRPFEAGIISINSTKYRSGNLFDRLLSLDIKDDGFRCLAPFSPLRGDIPERHTFVMAFNNALERILKNNLKSWQPLIRKYLAENTDYFMSIERDLRFYVVLIKYYKNCKNNSLDIVRPVIVSDNDNVFCKDIYYIQVALYSDEIVYNDIEFDENGQIYVLTGPNQGGKSVFLKAIGMNQALFQLGSYVNASKANLKITPNILIYLTKNDERSIGFGHLGEECNAVSKLLKYAGKDCLFLFDEAFSSTSASDQCYIACEILTALSKLKCYGLFITHNHDIYDKTREIILDNGDSKFDSLAALMSDSESAERSYKIVRKAPDRNSFAIDIAKKYNLQHEDILRGIVV
jgi:DNA mismatch repair ATPase MutS